MDDRYGVFVNHATGSSSVPKGGKMLVRAIDVPGNRFIGKARIRNGRIVTAWFPVKDATNARIRTVPSKNPEFGDAFQEREWAEKVLDRFEQGSSA